MRVNPLKIGRGDVWLIEKRDIYNVMLPTS